MFNIGRIEKFYTRLRDRVVETWPFKLLLRRRASSKSHMSSAINTREKFHDFTFIFLQRINDFRTASKIVSTLSTTRGRKNFVPGFFFPLSGPFFFFSTLLCYRRRVNKTDNVFFTALCRVTETAYNNDRALLEDANIFIVPRFMSECHYLRIFHKGKKRIPSIFTQLENFPSTYRLREFWLYKMHYPW